MKQARPWMFANMKITCQFDAHPLHQNSVDIFWAEIYRVRLLLGPNLVHEYQITAYPDGVDVLSPPPYCPRVSEDTGSSSCERKIFRPSVYIFKSWDTYNVSYALYCHVHPGCVHLSFVSYDSNSLVHLDYFLHPICHMPYIVMSFHDVFFYPTCPVF